MSTMMHEGATQPSVATTAPPIPPTRMPTKVAALMAMGPGVIWDRVTTSANSPRLSQPFISTTCSWISGIAAYPPPMLKSPI